MVVVVVVAIITLIIRMNDILSHGVDDIKARREAKKGPLQTIAEDWEWLPMKFRSWISRENHDFSATIAR